MAEVNDQREPDEELPPTPEQEGAEADLALLPKLEIATEPPVRPSPPKPVLPEVLASTAKPPAPSQPAEPTFAPLDNASGFDADATLDTLQQQQPAMESATRHDQAQQRAGERGKAKSQARKERLGRAAPAEPENATPEDRMAARGEARARGRKERLGQIAPQQPSHPVAGPLVDYEGAYQGQQRPEQQQPPNPNMGAGGGDNQAMGTLLDELRKQTALLTKLVDKIETVGTYGS